MPVEIDLAGMVIPITGSRGGLATATAELLRKAGATVVGLDLPSKDPHFNNEDFYPVNITDPVAVKEVFEQIVAKYGSVDGLVHCAGITDDAYAMSMTPEQFRRVVEVNQTGTFICMQAAARIMKVRGNCGSIVLFSSISREGNPGQINYAGSKAAVSAMANTAAREWGERYGIRVNAVAPGAVATTMLDKVPAETVKAWKKKSAFGRLTEAREIASTVLFLLSDLSSGITGETITVSCGLSFR